MYRINSLFKIAELDNYDQGCDPETTRMIKIESPFQCLDLKGLLDQVSKFLNEKDYQINPCEDEPDRVDWQVLETANSKIPSNRKLEQWKRGELDLYLCTYTAYVVKLESIDIAKELKNE